MGHEIDSNIFPAHFIDSLRILFDLLDKHRIGYLTYKEVCKQLPDIPSAKQLPPTFLEKLHNFTPSNGLISFQQFFEAVIASIDEQKMNDKINESNEKRRLPPTMGLNQQNRRSAYLAQFNATDCTEGISQVDFVKMREKKGQKSLRSNSSQQSQCYRIRPLSTNSVSSVASLGMFDQRWRNSHVSSSPSTASSQQNQDSALVTRHEALLEEEKEILNRGIDNGNRLVAWYKQRLASVQKRAELLTKGMVAMEPAVHEQKLNFLRAHATELNRRIISLMESSGRGFPTHSNLQVRTQLPQPNDNRTQQLEKQNKLLCQEIAEKAKLIEALRRENAENAQNYAELKKIHQQRISAVNSRPAAMVRPALNQKVIYKQAPSPIKVHDTLM